MLRYHMYFVFLKIIIFIQFVLIFSQVESVNSVYYTGFDIIFNISLALFLMLFFVVEKFSGVDFYDRYIVSAAGSFLLFNVMTGSLPKFLSNYGIQMPSWWPVQKG